MQGQAPEDPLDNEEQLQEQLESLPYLCRFKSDTMSAFLCQSFDQALQRYSALGQGATPNSTIEMEVLALKIRLKIPGFFYVWVVEEALKLRRADLDNQAINHLTNRVS